MMCVTYRHLDHAHIAHLGHVSDSNRYNDVSRDQTANESSSMRTKPAYSLRLVVLGLLGLKSDAVDDDISTTTIN